MTRSTVALVAPTIDMLGGNAIQARALDQGLRAEGYQVLFVPMNPRFPSGFRWLRRYPYVRTVLNEALYVPSLRQMQGADVVHVVSAAETSFIVVTLPAILAARGLGKRLVLHYHSGRAEAHLGRWGLLVHPWLRLADEIVVPSEYLRTIFARHGYRARVICNIVDTSRFCYRERKVLAPRLLSTRNLEALYGVENTVAAFARVRAHYPEATLTIVGFGSEEGRLRRLAQALGAEGIHFMGRVEPEVMPALYDEADIFLNSSVVDNQPVSVLEAFAAGLVVVSTPTGDLASLVRHGDTGLIVPPADPAAMANAVVHLLAAPSLAVTLTQRARQETERYTWSHVRDQWGHVYAGNGNHAV